MAEHKIDIEIKVPDENSPGYLKRLRTALTFMNVEPEKMTPQTIDNMVAFIADFVIVPEKREDAIELLWNASQADFQALMVAISGGDANPTEQ